MQWSVPCTKQSGDLRKQFAQWAIPKDLRNRHGIRDGDQYIFKIEHLNFSEELSLKVTSGGELRVPPRIADILQTQAKQRPDSSVTFVRKGDELLEEVEQAFNREVAASQMLSSEARRARLAAAQTQPRTREVTTMVYERNPDVVAEVLHRANGICERCKNPAPFLRRSDGSPYLEVHHIDQLAHGGPDTVENAEALCPNCHRKFHYGQVDT